MASTYLTRTPGSASNRQTWTFSVWIKRSGISEGVYNTIWNAGAGSGDDIRFSITTNDQLTLGTDATTFFVTNLRLRDPSAWYHLVLEFDTTNATAADRAKLYVNGEQITSFATNNISSLSGSYAWNNTVGHAIGRQYSSGTAYFNGDMAHIHFCDGTAYQSSAFGETDSTTGIWKPKLSPSVTYGTNGFFLKFASSGSMGTDSSGNGNTFTVAGGNLTQTQDTPSNVFATWNSLDKDGVASLSNGNTTFSSSASGGSSNCNLGMDSGKWYFELKHTSVNNAWVGIVPQGLYQAGTDLFTKNYTTGIYASNPNIYQNGTNNGSLGGGISTNDIMMYAIDMDNNQIYIGKNGNWNDGLGGGFDQSDFSNATAYSFNRYDDFYVVASVNGSGSTGYAHQINFGNGYFGTTAVSTANSDANGYGLFEYSVPSGYYALCTKNIKEFG